MNVVNRVDHENSGPSAEWPLQAEVGVDGSTVFIRDG